MSEEAKNTYKAWTKRAFDRASAYLRPGMRVTRKLCGGATGTFTFTHWEHDAWACGKSVSDCHVSSIIKVDGLPFDFTAGEPAPPPASFASLSQTMPADIETIVDVLTTPVGLCCEFKTGFE